MLTSTGHWWDVSFDQTNIGHSLTSGNVRCLLGTLLMPHMEQQHYSYYYPACTYLQTFVWRSVSTIPLKLDSKLDSKYALLIFLLANSETRILRPARPRKQNLEPQSTHYIPMHKCLAFACELCPQSCSDLFISHNEHWIHTTRSEMQHLLTVPRRRLAQSERGIPYFGVIICSSISDAIREAPIFNSQLLKYWSMAK